MHKVKAHKPGDAKYEGPDLRIIINVIFYALEFGILFVGYKVFRSYYKNRPFSLELILD